MTSVVSTRALTKRYGSVAAVDGVDLDIQEGDLFALLGPNGSGKSTTFRMLLGLVYATSGEIQLLGHSMPSAASRTLPHVGSLIEGPAFYPHHSGRANLTLLDASSGNGRRTRRARVREALERVRLDAGRLPYRAYSTGMKQRLGLAAALLRPRRLLILDEPTNGLDPSGTREMRDLLLQLQRSGTTILVSSHLLTEIELICTRAAILSEGRLVAQSKVQDLLSTSQSVIVVTHDIADAINAVGSIPGVSVLEQTPDGLVLDLNGAEASEVNASLVSAGVGVREFSLKRERLEDVFLRLTGA
ncbi:MAG: ABC transporter ATP-binding protein [Actinobacteria bacterium]|nr:ABC transporter ATP-binding protein [Actinomycetota bacterium]